MGRKARPDYAALDAQQLSNWALLLPLSEEFWMQGFWIKQTNWTQAPEFIYEET